MRTFNKEASKRKDTIIAFFLFGTIVIFFMAGMSYAVNEMKAFYFQVLAGCIHSYSTIIVIKSYANTVADEAVTELNDYADRIDASVKQVKKAVLKARKTDEDEK